MKSAKLSLILMIAGLTAGCTSVGLDKESAISLAIKTCPDFFEGKPKAAFAAAIEGDHWKVWERREPSVWLPVPSTDCHMTVVTKHYVLKP